MTVLVDAKYFGNILQFARKQQRIKTHEAAKIFHVSVRQFRRYEHGLDPIPENILMSLFHRGFCMLKCKC